MNAADHGRPALAPAQAQREQLMLELASSRTLAERLDRVAALFGDSVAQVHAASGTFAETPRAMSYSQLADSARRRCAALRQLGAVRGEVIAALLPISWSSYPTLLAATIAATLAPMNYFLEAEALIGLIRASGATLLLTAGRYDDDPQCMAKIERIRSALPLLRHLVYDVEAIPPAAPAHPALAALAHPCAAGAVSLDSASAATGPAWPADCLAHDPDRVAALFHTGGTTGLPKLVPHTEGMYLAMADACARAQGSCAGEVLMAPLPLFHTSGALQAGLVPLLSGAQLVLPCSRGFRAPEFLKEYWRFVERHRVSIIAGVPTILSALAATKPDADISSIRRVLVGGAPLSVHVIDQLRRLLGPHELLEGWGMTETCGFSALNPAGHARAGSAGVPLRGVELQVRKADAAGDLNSACAADEIGELVARGSIVIRRYHDERPTAFTADGWLRTGDRARIDSDGFLWITGRVKDLIIRGGHNIEPSLIEEAAYQHPAVQLAAAVGRPDRHAGEVPVLYVQLKQGAQCSAEEIATFIAPRILERAAIPKSVQVLPQLPLSGPGKISKLHLRREALRAVFQDEADAAVRGTDARVRVEVIDDDRFDQIAALHIEGGAPSAAAQLAVENALRAYTTRYRWL